MGAGALSPPRVSMDERIKAALHALKSRQEKSMRSFDRILLNFPQIRNAFKELRVDFDDFMSKLDDSIAVMMITNPSTLGLFEGEIGKIAELPNCAAETAPLSVASRPSIG